VISIPIRTISILTTAAAMLACIEVGRIAA
jgi:hypothetical protein